MSDFSNAKSPLSRFAIPSTVLTDTVWWRHVLMFSNCHTTLHRPPEPQDILFAVDATTSYGIGVVFGCHWESWKLLPGWNSHGRDIGWGEMVAIELGLRLVTALGRHDAHFILRSDNMGVIHALEGGRSRNLQQNRILQRIVILVCTHNVWLTTNYVRSIDNPADPPSRGLAPLTLLHLSEFSSPIIPFPLQGLITRS